MKTMIALTLAVFASSSYAADRIGNGGGIWACMPNSGLPATQAILVDIYEAQDQMGWKLQSYPSLLAAMDVVDLVMKQAALDLPTYAPLWANSLKQVKSELQFVNGDLEVVDDALFQLRPPAASCASGKWTYTQFANYNQLNQVLVSGLYWNSPLLSNLDKAGLMIHEAIYLWLRTSYQDSNSIRARYITDVILASSLSAAEKNKKVSDILQGPKPSPREDYFCVIQNRVNQQLYAQYGATEFETRNAALMACQAGPDSFDCNDFNTKCEMITTDELAWTCTDKNSLAGMTFLGRGRGNLESQYRAQQSCVEGSAGNGFFCFSQPPVCQAVGRSAP